MFKDTTERSKLNRGENNSKGSVRNLPLRPEDNPEAIKVLENGLQEAHLRQEASEAFSKFLKLLPSLYETSPHKYESSLAEIFWDKLGHHDPARTGLVDVLLNAVDYNVLNNYLVNLIEVETNHLKHKSPFRLSLEKWFHKWAELLSYKKRMGSNLTDYYEDALNERLVQLEQLKTALISSKETKNGNDKNSTVKLYPDDELVTTVESILTKGNYYYGNVFGAQVCWKEGFEAFLDQLRELNNQRQSRELLAHDASLVSLDFDVLLTSRLLLIENEGRPYLHRILNIIKALTFQNEKLSQRSAYDVYNQSNAVYNSLGNATEEINSYIKEKASLNRTILGLEQKMSVRHLNAPTGRRISTVAPHLEALIQENAEQMKTLHELNTRLASAQRDCALLPTVEEECRQLRRRLRKLECRLALLEDEKSGRAHPQGKPTFVPLLRGGPFAFSSQSNDIKNACSDGDKKAIFKPN
jgi:hypothetical protein